MEQPARRPTTAAPAPAVTRPLFEAVDEQRERITTDLYEAQLTSYGGALTYWELTSYIDKSTPGEPRVVLTTLDEPGEVALATPLLGLGLGDLSRAPYVVERPSSLSVVFTRASDDVAVRKTYEFQPDGYDYRLRIEVENRSKRVLTPTFEVRWRVSKREAPDFTDQALIALHDGGVERGRVDALGKRGFFARSSVAGEGKTFLGDVEWAGAELRYFLAALIPEVPREASAMFKPLEPGRAGDAILAFRPIEVPPGNSAAREFRGYIGPKEPERLAALGAGLEHSIDVGWSWVSPLSRFFAWMLHVIHDAVPNYGVGIIILTVLVRLATAPLTTRQMRSMKRMGELQPKMRELQEKHKDDKQSQSQAMMKLYRETGVNPLGGCLPLVLQFPVFIGLYYALQSSIDLRQAPFVGWIDDLSRPEELFTIPGLELPVRVLPLVMGASMILQQRMTPTTMDPQQARMMMTVMPVMFTVLFYRFPSGLVLYWMVSNLLAIGHQMWVNRQKKSA
jgi:YidC/Oxa1 family membrane protein insertase